MCVSAIEIGPWSEWAAAVLSFITILLLRSTLIDQRRTLNLQQEQFRISIRPYYKLFRSFDNETIEDLIFLECRNENPIFELIIFGDHEFLRKRDEISSISPERKILLFKGRFREPSASVNVFVFFKDEQGNQYSQHVHGNLPDLAIDPPMRVVQKN